MEREMKLNTPGFIGDKLKEAREARGLIASNLADLIQVSKQSVSKYESGLQSPSPEVMDEICNTLKLPLEFFVYSRKRQIDNNAPIFFRARATKTDIQLHKAEKIFLWFQDIASYLMQYVEFPKNNLPVFDDIPDDPLLITDDLIEKVAIRVRRYWGLGDGPISNMIWLLENNGIMVGCYSFEYKNLDAFSQMVFDRPHIFLSTAKLSTARMRFSAAHELGHLILHKNISNKTFEHGKYFSLLEKQADRFSSAFHLTAEAFAKEVSTVSLDGFRVLKSRWKISIGAFIHRAISLGYINEEESQKFWRNYTRRGWRNWEPLDDTISPEQPMLIKNSFDAILENGIQTKSQIVSSLRLNPRDIEQIASLPEHYLRPTVIPMPEIKNKFIKREITEPQKDNLVYLFSGSESL